MDTRRIALSHNGSIPFEEPSTEQVQEIEIIFSVKAKNELTFIPKKCLILQSKDFQKPRFQK